MKTSRLEAFSDAVLAIIITIMVLELHVPEGHEFSDLVHDTGSSLLTYLLSFVYVGIYWNNHHHMFQLTRRVTGAVLWANLALLFVLSLFPFTTAWMDDSDLARVPVVVYGLNLLIAATVYYVLQRVIIRSQGAESPLRDAVGGDSKGRISPVLYLAGILSAALLGRPGVFIGIGFFVVVAIMWFIPDRRIEAAVQAHGGAD